MFVKRGEELKKTFREIKEFNQIKSKIGIFFVLNELKNKKSLIEREVKSREVKFDKKDELYLSKKAKFKPKFNLLNVNIEVKFKKNLLLGNA